jgi:hypothetical protein
MHMHGMRPMHPRTITTALRAQRQDSKYEPVAWNCQTTRRGLPRALWDKYDPNQDPTVPKSNTTDPKNDLLSGSNFCTQLTTGVTLSPPPPEISSDNLEPLNAIESNKRNVCGDHPLPSWASSRPWPIFSPGVLEPTPKHWKTAADAWSRERPTAQGLVEAWAAALSWDQGAASMKKLSAAVPKMYIAKRGSLWMRAPSLGVVV